MRMAAWSGSAHRWAYTKRSPGWAYCFQYAERPQIKFKEAEAYYDPRLDLVNMPKHKSFNSDAAYYSTLFHELIHSTGMYHGSIERILSRCRSLVRCLLPRRIDCWDGACYLQSVAGIIEQFEQNAAYIQGWLKRLQNDRKFIFSAAIAAQKATDYILSVKHEEYRMRIKTGCESHYE